MSGEDPARGRGVNTFVIDGTSAGAFGVI